MDGDVTDPDATVALGAAVTVAIRPERMEVLPAGTATASATGAGRLEVAGRVRQGTYLGDQTEYRIETKEAGEVIVRRQNAAGSGGALGVGPGDPVVVRWHEDAHLILAG
jgi:ABC-type Fe3+/spermidine/putrescine transport system ATPase subunit